MGMDIPTISVNNTPATRGIAAGGPHVITCKPRSSDVVAGTVASGSFISIPWTPAYMLTVHEPATKYQCDLHEGTDAEIRKCWSGRWQVRWRGRWAIDVDDAGEKGSPQTLAVGAGGRNVARAPLARWLLLRTHGRQEVC